ncbi:MAG: putative zinc-binding protein [Kiritimatiellae bacterium]|jgi:uncharacterized metal-binding protein|nr:putative zinc-binding protein [Kiritimatiellia bacterium]
MSSSNDCKGGKKLIFACSGAADVGAISDQAARKLTCDGVGNIFCLVGVGGRVDSIMKITASADDILVLDGCPLNCAKNCLEQAGFVDFKHLLLNDIGLEKGQTPISDENINFVAQAGKDLLEGTV